MTIDDFNITKNVEESYTLNIQGFVTSTTPVARISGSIAITATPSVEAKSSVALELSSPSMTVTATKTPGTAGTGYSGAAGDCYIYPGDTTSFDSTSIAYGLGNLNEDYNWKTWIPFTVDLPQATVIESATITFVATYMGQQKQPVKIKIGCDDRGIATAPTTYADLNSRTMTSNVTVDDNMPFWNPGSTYSYDITTAVQEILNRTDWVNAAPPNGNLLAVMIVDNGSGEGWYEHYDYHREAASYENTTYDPPLLKILT
jgi:hypothetical protein